MKRLPKIPPWKAFRSTVEMFEMWLEDVAVPIFVRLKSESSLDGTQSRDPVNCGTGLVSHSPVTLMING